MLVLRRAGHPVYALAAVVGPAHRRTKNRLLTRDNLGHNGVMNNTTTTIETTEIQARKVRLGDQVLLATWRGTVELVTVTKLEAEGEDVVINDTITTSGCNWVTKAEAVTLEMPDFG